jgi:hypothetical protein
MLKRYAEKGMAIEVKTSAPTKHKLKTTPCCRAPTDVSNTEQAGKGKGRIIVYIVMPQQLGCFVSHERYAGNAAQ